MPLYNVVSQCVAERADEASISSAVRADIPTLQSPMNKESAGILNQATGFFQDFTLGHLEAVDQWETTIGSQLLSMIRTVQWQLLAQVCSSLWCNTCFCSVQFVVCALCIRL